jgi:hypothetical protein
MSASPRTSGCSTKRRKALSNLPECAIFVRHISGNAQDEPSPLTAEKHPQGDLFVCDVADAVLKDIMPQMENPFYSLSKKPDMKVRRYEHNGNWLEPIPSYIGLATIYDKDILIYCISHLVQSIRGNRPVSSRVRITAHDLLRFTHRGVSPSHP